MRISGKTVVITGGAKGIGATAARAFCEQGAQVAIIDFDEKAGEALAQQLHAEGNDAAFLRQMYQTNKTWTQQLKPLQNSSAQWIYS